MQDKSLASASPRSTAAEAPPARMESNSASPRATPPFLLAPAGIFLESSSARCLGSISEILRSVEHNRTPQLMSNPTPPGEIEPPCSPQSTSVATTPPIGKPYPKCQSAIAHASPTIPGRLAVFTSWAGDLSSEWPDKCLSSDTSIASVSILPCFEILILPGPSDFICLFHDASIGMRRMRNLSKRRYGINNRIQVKPFNA